MMWGCDDVVFFIKKTVIMIQDMTNVRLPQREKPAYFFDRKTVDQAIRQMDLQQVRVLDIGCGVPWTAYELERIYQLRSFTCLDKLKTQSHALEAYSFFHGPGINQFKSFSDLHYSMNHQYIKASQSSYHSIKSFRFLYDIQMGYDIRQRDLSQLGQYDIIVVQDVLHLLPYSEAIPIVAQLCNLLLPEGIIYLQLPYIYHEQLSDPQRSYRIGKHCYEHIYISETACLYDEYRFAELIEVLHRHGIEMLVGPEMYANDGGEGIGWIGAVGRKRHK